MRHQDKTPVKQEKENKSGQTGLFVCLFSLSVSMYLRGNEKNRVDKYSLERKNAINNL